MRRIPLTRGQFAIVDDADFDCLNQWSWQAAEYLPGSFRAKRGIWKNGRVGTIFMHRQILGFPQGKQIDHRNGDALDNQRSNLRVCDVSKNASNRRLIATNNRSGFKGVSRRDGCWRAQIQCNHRNYFLGSFASAVEAAKAHDRAAVEAFGEFARVNFPEAI